MNSKSIDIKKISKELEKYKSGDKSSTKDLLQAMKESSAWLSEQLQKMNILVTATYEDQLKAIMEDMLQKDSNSLKGFKMYLDTILLNIPTKDKKYKPSKYFDDEDVKDVEHEGLTIPFYYDQEKHTYVILGILKS